MTPRVLVVDDDAALRRALASALKREGFAVTTAEDATPAIALSETQQFDLVVVDFHMKTASGAEVVRHYKARQGQQIFCVVLSGDDDAHIHAECNDAGANAVMLKPAPVGGLRKLLSDAARAMQAPAA